MKLYGFIARNSGIALAAGGSESLLRIDGQPYDPDGLVSLVNEEATIQVAGLYLVASHVFWEHNLKPAKTIRWNGIKLDPVSGTDQYIAEDQSFSENVFNDSRNRHSPFCVVHLDVGDKLSGYQFHGEAAAIDVNQLYFAAILLYADGEDDEPDLRSIGFSDATDRAYSVGFDAETLTWPTTDYETTVGEFTKTGNRWIFPRTGAYFVYSYVTYSANATGERRNIRMAINTPNPMGSEEQWWPESAGFQLTLSAFAVAYAVANGSRGPEISAHVQFASGSLSEIDARGGILFLGDIPQEVAPESVGITTDFPDAPSIEGEAQISPEPVGIGITFGPIIFNGNSIAPEPFGTLINFNDPHIVVREVSPCPPCLIQSPKRRFREC